MPHKNLSEIVPWLFRMSHIYRHWVAARRTPNAEEVQHDIREALQRLIAYTEAKGIRLSVLIHPVLKPRAEWNRHNVYRHEWIERTLEELGVRKFVLIEPLERALAEGVDPLQTPNDYEHPSHEVSRYFAADLREKGLLEGP
jgi:hypothetical protein